MGHGAGSQSQQQDAYMITEAGKNAAYHGPLWKEAGLRGQNNTFWSLATANAAASKLNALNKGAFEVKEHELQGLFDAFPGR